MSLSVHRVPAEIFARLAQGGGGTDGVGLLVAAQHSKHAILLRQVVELARRAEHEQAQRAVRAFELLAEIQQADAGAVSAVIYHPAVGAWAERTIRLLSEPESSSRADVGQLAAIAAAAAARARVKVCVRVTASDDSVMLPSIGKITAPASAGSELDLDIRDGEIAATGSGSGSGSGWIGAADAYAFADGPGWQHLRCLSARSGDLAIRVVVDDLDDYRMPGYANLSGRLPADGSPTGSRC